MRATRSPWWEPISRHASLRPGLLLRRHPRVWWLVVLAAALAAGWLASSAVTSAEQARAAWGATRRVVVVERARDAGDELRPGDLAVDERPAAMVPASALETLPDRAVLRAAVVAGEVLVAERIAPAGLSDVAARLPTDHRAVAIPTEPGYVPPLAVGDRVDVLVALPSEAAGGGPPGFVLAARVLVVGIDEATVTVAVPRDAAPRVAVALGQGAVTLALVGA